MGFNIFKRSFVMILLITKMTIFENAMENFLVDFLVYEISTEFSNKVSTRKNWNREEHITKKHHRIFGDLYRAMDNSS